MLGQLGRVTNILRFSSKSRTRKDGGSNAKRQRAQSYDTVNDYQKGGASVKDGSSPASPDRRREGEGQPNPPSPADDESSGSMSTEADRQPLREGGGAPLATSSMDPRALEARQLEEKEFIRQHDTAEAQLWYLVDVQWLQAWKQFVTRGGMLPGPIENGRLIDRQTGHPRPGLKAVGDYRGVNDAIWYFWHQRYGGGPVICRKHLDLYSPPVKEPEELALRSRGLATQLPGANPSSDPNADGSASHAAPRSENPWRGGPRVEAQPRAGERDEQSDNSNSSGNRREEPPARGSAERSHASSTSVPRRAQSNSSSSFFSLSGSRGQQASSSSGRTQPQPSGRGRGAAGGEEEARRPGPSPPKEKLCCDKCDGPHETDKCPHFKKARESHEDAWANKGKAKSIKDESENAPVIRSERAKVVPQPGDGSCLFHSLSYGLNDRSSASTLRKEICGYIAKNPDMKIADTAIKDWIQYDSNDSVYSYAQRMSGGTWGGGIEMAALTRMKNVNVHVYEKCSQGYRRISAFESPGAYKTVSVLYQGRMHYDAIEV